MLPDRFPFYAALVQVTRKPTTVFCRHCHRVITVKGDALACGPHYCRQACQEAALHAYHHGSDPATIAADAIPATYPSPQRFVCWPTEVSPDGIEVLVLAAEAMTTKAQARDVVTLIRCMLDEYRAAIVRWIVLEGLLNDPLVIPDRLAFFLFADEERDDRMWWRRLMLINPRLAANGKLGVRVRAELEGIVVPLVQFFMHTQLGGVGFEQQIAPEQRPYVTYRLAMALCQLEARLVVEATWTIEDWLGGNRSAS